MVDVGREEHAIRELLERRRVVWNSRDRLAYRALFTSDVEIVSATGRTSRGIDDAMALYTVQKQQPSYRDAIITATLIDRVAWLSGAEAQVFATYQMTGVCIPPDTLPREVEGRIVFSVRKQEDAWKIAGLHAEPPSKAG
jgi:uncharacterized protein (TIGR02246 family)